MRVSARMREHVSYDKICYLRLQSKITHHLIPARKVRYRLPYKGKLLSLLTLALAKEKDRFCSQMRTKQKYIKNIMGITTHGYWKKIC